MVGTFFSCQEIANVLCGDSETFYQMTLCPYVLSLTLRTEQNLKFVDFSWIMLTNI